MELEMTKSKVIENVLLAIEHGEKAQAGRADGETRRMHRAKCAEYLNSIPRRDYKKIPDELLDVLARQS